MTKKVRIAIVFSGVLLLFVSIFFTMKSIHTVKDLPEIVKSGRINVLADSSSIGFSEKNGNVSGFQYELVKAFADTLGLELVITEENDIGKCVANLFSGEYDLVAQLTPITTEFKDKVAFTTAFFSSRQVLVQQLKTNNAHQKLITKAIQLENDTLYIPSNSSSKLRINNLSAEIARPIVIIEIKNKSTEDLVKLVAQGKIKQTICDERFAQKLKNTFPTIDVSVPLGFDQNMAWMVHIKSPLLREKLNEFLADFVSSSAYWEIYRKYYN